MRSVIRGCGEQALRTLDRPYSEIDVLTAFGAAVARVLIDIGFVTFNQVDVARQLWPGHRVTSTGAYILVR